MRLYLTLIIAVGLVGLLFYYLFTKERPRILRGLRRFGLMSLVTLILLWLVLEGQGLFVFGILMALSPLLFRNKLSFASIKIPEIKRPQWKAYTPPPPRRPLSPREEAFKTLGLRVGAGENSIRKAHRKLMMDNHPDRGGNPHQAARINQARDILLKKNS